MTPKQLPVILAFVHKLEEIRQHPYQLRRTIAAWPYYDCLFQIVKHEEDPQVLQALQKIYP